MENKENKIFYGWYVVAVAFVANFVTVGTSFYIFNAIMEPLCQTRGWTRTEVNLALVMGTFFAFGSQLVYGTLVMRTGPRLLMLVGPLVAGAAAIVVGQTTSLVGFYLAFMVLFLGNGAFGGIVANTAVSNWFVLKRGKALGLATAAVSLSGAVVPFSAMLLINAIGMAWTFCVIGLFIMLVGPFAWLVIKNWPEEHGMAPDGLAGEQLDSSAGQNGKRPEEPAVKEHEKEPDWPLSALLRSPAFWKLGFAYALTMVGVVGVMSQLKPRFKDLDFSDTTAMAMMAATALVGSVGKYAWGTLCDRFDSRRVAAALVAANGLGLLLSLWQGGLVSVVLFILVFGFAMGGVMSTYPIITADLFGRKSFASVLRFVSLFLALQLAGYIIAGQSFDRTGSYDMAYLLFAALDAVAVYLLFTLKRPSRL